MKHNTIAMENLYVSAIMEGKAKAGMITRKSPYKGILFALAVRIDDGFGYLNFLDEVIDESDVEDFWEAAYKNTEFDSVLSDMGSALGFDKGDMPFPLVLTNGAKAFGAGSLVCDGIISKAIELCGGKAFMLPSSIHEVLFTPADDFASLEEMNQMVREVNNAEVEPDIWLSDRAYFVTVDENGKVVVR